MKPTDEERKYFLYILRQVEWYGLRKEFITSFKENRKCGDSIKDAIFNVAYDWNL